MHTSDGAIDPGLRQARLSSFGRALATMTLVLATLNGVLSIWLRRVSFNGNSVPLRHRAGDGGRARNGGPIIAPGSERAPEVCARLPQGSRLSASRSAVSTSDLTEPNLGACFASDAPLASQVQRQAARISIVCFSFDRRY